MIFVEDYRNLPVLRERRILNASELLGRAVTVYASAGEFRGIIVGDEPDTLTLACARRVCGRSESRKIIVSKRHIIAIETRLD